MSIKARMRALNKKMAEQAAASHQEAQTIRCQGCGKILDPDTADLENVEYVKTKRGTEWFFHAGCKGQVWSRKIV